MFDCYCYWNLHAISHPIIVIIIDILIKAFKFAYVDLLDCRAGIRRDPQLPAADAEEPAAGIHRRPVSEEDAASGCPVHHFPPAQDERVFRTRRLRQRLHRKGGAHLESAGSVPSRHIRQPDGIRILTLASDFDSAHRKNRVFKKKSKGGGKGIVLKCG